MELTAGSLQKMISLPLKSDIMIKKPVVINKHGKTVWYYDAWKEIEVYYQELKAGGFLEM